MEHGFILKINSTFGFGKRVFVQLNLYLCVNRILFFPSICVSLKLTVDSFDVTDVQRIELVFT